MEEEAIGSERRRTSSPLSILYSRIEVRGKEHWIWMQNLQLKSVENGFLLTAVVGNLLGELSFAPRNYNNLANCTLQFSNRQSPPLNSYLVAKYFKVYFLRVESKINIKEINPKCSFFFFFLNCRRPYEMKMSEVKLIRAHITILPRLLPPSALHQRIEQERSIS